jgi:hypothetical protein
MSDNRLTTPYAPMEALLVEDLPLKKLARDTPAQPVVFDLLADPSGRALVDRPLRKRRALLEAFAARKLAGIGGFRVSPATTDPETAEGRSASYSVGGGFRPPRRRSRPSRISVDVRTGALSVRSTPSAAANSSTRSLSGTATVPPGNSSPTMDCASRLARSVTDCTSSNVEIGIS